MSISIFKLLRFFYKKFAFVTGQGKLRGNCTEKGAESAKNAPRKGRAEGFRL